MGLAPQVLTETLWCLAHETPAFVPTEIHAITTLEGRHRADLMLLDPPPPFSWLWRKISACRNWRER